MKYVVDHEKYERVMKMSTFGHLYRLIAWNTSVFWKYIALLIKNFLHSRLMMNEWNSRLTQNFDAWAKLFKAWLS